MKTILYTLFRDPDLSSQLVRRLGAASGELEVRQFPDGETYLRVLTPPEGRDAALLVDFAEPDPKFLAVAYAADTLRDMGARSVGLIAPYLPYMRQDKRFQDGEAITSETFSRLLNTTVDWLITVDPHLHRRGSLAEIYSVPAATLHAAKTIGTYVKQHFPKPLLVGPDSESSQWVAAVADAARAPFIVLEKTRRGDRDVEVSVPEVAQWAGYTPILVDDIISTARTMIETVRHLRAAGMARPVCIGVHALFAGTAYEDLMAAGAGDIITCNSVPHASNKIDLAELIAAGVQRLVK